LTPALTLSAQAILSVTAGLALATPIIAVALVLIRMVYVEGMWTPAPKLRPIQNRVDAEAPPCGERYRNIPQRLALPRIAGTMAGIRLGSNGRHEQLKRE
jgi:hypothetical protein